MRKWIAALAFLATGLAVCFLISKKGNAPSSVASQEKIAAEDAAVANALAKQSPQTVAVIESNFARARPAQVVADTAAKIALPAAGPPIPAQFTNFPPDVALANMRRAIRQYGDMFGGNPIGTNPEITRQLGGDNPKHINFLNTEAGMRVSQNGELVDPWGTPYFFHQLSGHDMEIHSAGPDGLMWTSDDLVLK